MKEGTSNKPQSFWIFMVIFFTIVISFFSFYFQSETAKTDPEVKLKIVRTFTAKKTNHRATVSAFGTVQPVREVTLRSEVSGRVMEQSPNLVIGGIVEKGEVLLQLDQRDYRNIIEQEKAALERAKFELQLEQGRQIVAKKEWEQIGPTIKKAEISEDLALRIPHLKEKKAAYAAALSRLEKAELDLQRTVIQSPMNAVVVTEGVEIGDYITPQTEVAKIVATDSFQVQVSVPVNKLQWIRMPTKNDPGSPVELIQDIGEDSVMRKGEILRLLSDLDPSGRMARVLIEIKDPLELKNQNSKQLPLLIGTYIRAEFEGPQIEGVFVLPREALREDNKVWVKNDNNELEVRDVQIVEKDEKFAIVNEGISEGEEIILTNLPLAIPGMKLRSLDED